MPHKISVSLLEILSKALNPSGRKDDIEKTEKFLEGRLKDQMVYGDELHIAVISNLINFRSLEGFNKDEMTFSWGWNEHSTDIWPRKGCIILCKTRAVGDPKWMRGMLEPFKIISPEEWETEIQRQIPKAKARCHGKELSDCELREEAKKMAIAEINMMHHGYGQIIPLFVGPFKETD